MASNIYRIDDALIRAGFLFGIIALIAAFNLPTSAGGRVPATVMVLLPLFVAAPVFMLIAGYAVRRRERRLLEIWRLLKEHGEMPVADLRDMSGYSRRELRKAVSLLNRKIAAGLTWDQGGDTIRHVSLGPRETLAYSQRCASCGASVSIEIAAHSKADELNCPYCQGSLDGREISKLQNELLAREARGRNPEPAPIYLSMPATAPRPSAKRFNLGLFIFLLFIFWPAAVIYAIHRANSARTF